MKAKTRLLALVNMRFVERKDEASEAREEKETAEARGAINVLLSARVVGHKSEGSP